MNPVNKVAYGPSPISAHLPALDYLYDLINMGNVDLLNRYLLQHPPINDISVWTHCFHCAVNANKYEAIPILLHFANTMGVHNKITAVADIIINATKKADPQCLKVLINAGFDCNARDLHGNTPLLWAAFHGQPEHMLMLINAGVEVSVKNNLGYDLNDMAMRSSNRQCCNIAKRELKKTKTMFSAKFRSTSLTVRPKVLVPTPSLVAHSEVYEHNKVPSFYESRLVELEAQIARGQYCASKANGLINKEKITKERLERTIEATKKIASDYRKNAKITESNAIDTQDHEKLLKAIELAKKALHCEAQLKVNIFLIEQSNAMLTLADEMAVAAIAVEQRSNMLINKINTEKSLSVTEDNTVAMEQLDQAIKDYDVQQIEWKKQYKKMQLDNQWLIDAVKQEERRMKAAYNAKQKAAVIEAKSIRGNITPEADKFSEFDKKNDVDSATADDNLRQKKSSKFKARMQSFKNQFEKMFAFVVKAKKSDETFLLEFEGEDEPDVLALSATDVSTPGLGHSSASVTPCPTYKQQNVNKSEALTLPYMEQKKAAIFEYDKQSICEGATAAFAHVEHDEYEGQACGYSYDLSSDTDDKERLIDK